MVARPAALTDFVSMRMILSNCEITHLRGVVDELDAGDLVDLGAARFMVIAMSVLGALKDPALRERLANETWDTGIDPERRIIARVDAECERVVEIKAG